MGIPLKRRWKILLGLLVALAVLLAVNAVTTSSQTKEAGTTVDAGQILKLSSGDVQVTDSGPADGQTVVLIHPYAGSLHWFDKLEPLLESDHRVIRIDLLGFGGSEKPESGYSIPEQASTVAEALNQMDVEGALVAGNSLGGMVATSLAEQASQLVDRVVLLDMAPNTSDYGDGLPFIAKAGYVPVLGQVMWRVTPDFAIRDGFKDSFAPGFDMDSGFDDPDQVVEDFNAMTYTSYHDVHAEADAYVDELPLDERFKQASVPLLVVFGAEDQIFDAQEAIEAYGDVPGVQTEIVEDSGHAPQVEQPEAVAKLIDGFATQAFIQPAPPPKAQKENSAKKQGKPNRKERHGGK